MKFLVLSLFIINILSSFNTVSSVSSDCTNLNNFLNVDATLNCCETNYAACDNGGNIILLEFMNFEQYKSYDSQKINLGSFNYDNFPIFQKLKNRTFSGIENFNKNILPTKFFDQPSLKYLRVTSNGITTIPQNINKNSLVEIIELYINVISEFPYQLKDLKNLKELHIALNDISGDIDLKEFNTLTKLDIHQNSITNITNIPSTLTYLDIANTAITELPPSLFKLKNLKEFYLENNPNLKAKIIGFENPIYECGFNGTSIECYKPGSCTNIVTFDENDNISSIKDGNEKISRECIDSEIQEIKNKEIAEESINQNTTNNNSKKDGNDNNNYLKYIIIGGCSILVLILLSVFIVKYYSSSRDTEEEDEDEIVHVTTNNNNSIDINNGNNGNNDNNMNSSSSNNNINNMDRILESNNDITSRAAWNSSSSEKPPPYESIVDAALVIS
ncbi:L domain-like protein [Anaeromyces robustus]|uniref:L domain-like protein n=1 Tax=Anaeromyces robustus TaxID=1754192 RepID=A0A1Y1XAP4_9FUNG|nr:L domain-like protein [Anaeromyces robustus]|eukprot:ORX82787.1 L domain-like protein [Anaeromyces robustus]